jgi:hypothetical protein
MLKKLWVPLISAVIVVGSIVFPNQTKGANNKSPSYFVMAVWAQPPESPDHKDNFGFWKSIGMNTLVGHDTGPQKKVTEKEWDTKAKAAGLKVIRRPSSDISYDVQQYNAGHLVSWMIPDEQDKIAANKGQWNDATVKEAVLNYVTDMRKKAPQIPVTANFMGSQLGYSRNNWYKQAVDSLDFYSYDWYPFNTGYEIETTFIERTKTITNWTGKYPMIYIETSDQRLKKDPANSNPAYSYRVSRMRGPTPQEIRMEMALAVSLGTPGLMFFADSFYPFEYDGTTLSAAAMIKQETAVWSKLSPAPGTDIPDLPEGLMGRVRVLDGQEVKIVTNYTNTPKTYGRHTIAANDYLISKTNGEVIKPSSGNNIPAALPNNFPGIENPSNSNPNPTPNNPTPNNPNPTPSTNTNALTVSCAPRDTETVINDRVSWNATVKGGKRSYKYTWSGTDIPTKTGSRLSTAYAQAGTKNVSLTVQSADGQTKTVQCGMVVIKEHPLIASCAVSALPSSGNGMKIKWYVSASGGNRAFTYTWTGTDGLASTEKKVEKIYTTGGTKEAHVQIVSGSQTKNLTCKVIVPEVITANQLFGSCSGDLRDERIRWEAEAEGRGKDRTFTYSSEGVTQTGSKLKYTHSYTSAGVKNAQFTIATPASTIQLQCAGVTVFE